LLGERLKTNLTQKIGGSIKRDDVKRQLGEVRRKKVLLL
jgi:hypothetical protein